MDKLIAALTAFLFIAAGAWLTQPKPHYNRINFDQIKTDAVTNYGHQASAGRTWCVEQAE